jgi:transcriptional regulator with XRE-family HTH domain
MARKTLVTNGGGGGPVELNFRTKEAVGQRIHKLMLAKGWTQADLSRHSELTKDSISTYIRGKVAPTPLSCQKLARALGVSPDEFATNPIAQAIAESRTLFDMRESEDEPGMVHIRMDRLVPKSIGAKISTLIYGDESTD